NIREYLIPVNTNNFFLHSKGFRDKYIFPSVKMEDPLLKIEFLELKMERLNTSLIYQDILSTGSQPKSVEFSENGKYLAVALLNGSGVDIFSMDDMTLKRTLKPPEEWSKKKGFVETVFLKTRNELWVSQMTTGMIHVFDTINWNYKQSFDCGGSWPKVILLNNNEDTAYISNWTSKNISVIDTSDYSVIKTISVNGIPRGMAISPGEKFLYVGNFTSGDINKIDIEKYILLKNIDLGDGALRHVVLSEKNNKLYVSDMYHGTISVLDLKTDSVERSFYAGSNINTIKLSTDEEKLYISSRGHNNEEGYLQKGPEFGKIYVYDTVINKITDWTWGGNQPTGLAVSPDGSIIVFSDFLDHQIEIYRLHL
ncbi:MAG: YncE family protein, partial [Spirochaetales bacterium]|nr:YncE family protein [Spirochaetales bacterium]